MIIRASRQELFSRGMDLILSVPVRIKIAGIMALPVLILGFTLNYWVRTGLSDWLSYLLSDERVRIAMTAGSRSVLFVSLLAAVASVLLSFLLIYVLTKPLMQVRQTAIRITRGRLDSRARVWSKDEIGEVAESINAMIDMLVESQAELKKANLRLKAMNQVAMAAGRKLDLEAVLQSAMQEMLRVMDWKIGWIFLKDSRTGRFSLAKGNQDTLVNAFAGFLDDPQPCACQRDLLDGILEAGVLRDCQRLAEVEQCGFQAKHLTIPVEQNGQVFALINLLCSPEKPPDEEDLDLLRSMGAQVSEIAANAWLHTHVVEKEASRQALLSALVKAQEAERARLSRDLHDGAGQMLTSLLVRIKTMEIKFPSDTGLEAHRSALGELCGIVSVTIGRVRDIAQRYRPLSLEEFGLRLTLAMLIDEMASAGGLDIDFEYGLKDMHLPEEVEITIYRIVQECLTNIVRHAQAHHVRIQAEYGNGQICLVVVDDGIGFEPHMLENPQSIHHLGLLGLRERVEAMGGILEIKSSPQIGSTIQASFPLIMEIGHER